MIKNIVFDVGNVLVRWDPASVVARIFPENNYLELTQKFFKSSIWYDLNLGKISMHEAVNLYHINLGIDLDRLTLLVEALKESLLPIDPDFNLLAKLYQRHYALYALTDNVHEIVAYLKTKYHFWDKFKGVVVSAEVGYLKPSPEIYQYLLNKYQLIPQETIFIDDFLSNVEGARALGINGVHFVTLEQCIKELKQFQVNF